MRDQEYEKQPSPETYRIALLGASTVMGWGVQQDESFEALLEGRLNREHTNGPYTRYEILNFAVSGYMPLQQRVVLEKAFQFNPKVVFYMTLASGGEAEEAARYLVDVVRKKIDVPYENLLEIIQRAGLKAGMEETEAIRRLEPLQYTLLEWLYHDMAKECRARGVLPVWIFVPQPYLYSRTERAAKARRLAEDAGFTVIDLSDIYSGYNDVSSLRLADWDHHHNAKGHQLIAEQLYEALREKDEILALGLFGSMRQNINLD
jgi:lysophospholipase L1-like esterase